MFRLTKCFTQKYLFLPVENTKTVVGVNVVPDVVVAVIVVGATVVTQGYMSLLMVPFSPHTAVIQLPSPSVVWYIVDPYEYLFPL